jgi:hypothetical protein
LLNSEIQSYLILEKIFFNKLLIICKKKGEIDCDKMYTTELEVKEFHFQEKINAAIKITKKFRL